MQQKHNRLKLGRYALALVLLILVAATSVVLLHRRTDASPAVKPAVGAAVPSVFSFAGTSGWWQGATNKTSMALFHNSDGCFTSVQYSTGTVDATAELQKFSVSQAGYGGSSTPGAVLPVALQTNTGSQQYQLHQYTLTGASGEKLMTGLELGYLQLTGGYVKVEGHCDTPDQLPATIPALRSVKFDAAKV